MTPDQTVTPDQTALTDGADLVLDGARYPAVWLRDNCPCPACALPGSGQKLFGITDLPSPAQLRIASARRHADEVAVRFAPDGHVSTFPVSFLEAHRLGTRFPADERTEDAKTCWTGADFTDRSALPRAAWEAFVHDDAVRARCLDALLTSGFFLLHEVPVRERAVLGVAEASATYARPTTDPCSTYGSSRIRRTSPSAPCRSHRTPHTAHRTPTTRTAIRCPPSSCCTV